MVRKIKFRLFASLLVVALGFSLVSVVPKSLADSGTIYVSPGSETETDGSTFTVDVEVNPGTSINAVQVAASYDSSMLQYDSSTPVTFTLCAQNTGGGGSVSMGCSGSATSSQVEVATITFTALAGSGSTSIGLSGSYAASTGSPVSLSPESATISFAPTPAPSSGSGGGGTTTTSHATVATKASSQKASSGGTTSTSSTVTTAVATPAAVVLPKISINKVSVQTGLTTASVSVTSSSAVQSVVKYGGSPASLAQSVTSSGVSKTNVLKLSNLSTAKTYYYQVEDVYSGSVISSSKVKTFTTKGFSLSVVVLDSQYKPLANQVVYLHSNPIKAVTNSKGIASFYNVPSGVHHLDYTSDGKSYSQVVYVSNSVINSPNGAASAPSQTQSVILSGFTAKSSSSLRPLILTLVLLVILGFAFVSITSNGHRSQVRSFFGKS